MGGDRTEAAPSADAQSARAAPAAPDDRPRGGPRPGRRGAHPDSAESARIRAAHAQRDADWSGQPVRAMGRGALEREPRAVAEDGRISRGAAAGTRNAVAVGRVAWLRTRLCFSRKRWPR